MDTKSFAGLEIKDAAQGIATAVFSTFGVVDYDGDIVEPGAIKDGTPIRISAYGHASWGGAGSAMLPVGKGVIHTDGEKAWADMEFFMDTTNGRDTFGVVKGMGSLQEWSYSLHNLTATQDEIDGKAVRRIKAVDVHEVSPVLKGASIGTHTMSAKGDMKFVEHIDAVVADVVKLSERAHQVMALRAQKGGQIAGASREQLDALAAQLKSLQELLTAEPAKGLGEAEHLQREYLRFLSLT